jgi:alpha-amylase/alpha-mannosidase (GH57 family)
MYLSGQYFADLVTWFHLVWTGETERRNVPLLAELMSHGGRFGVDDRRQLLAWIGDTLRRLVPRYAALAARGQIELSTTPFAHPLAPLMIDFRSAREALPDANLPASPNYPGGKTRVDAHIERALNSHAARFAAPVRGVWPAEGAISTPFLTRLAQAGVAWTASSESVLANSLRAASPELPPRETWIYRPWQLDAAPGLRIHFRDERLSDLIGFEYAKWHGRDAAGHFTAQLEAIAQAAPAGDVPLVSVMLDGENAWEHYPYNGYYFFEDLYSTLEAHPRIRLSTFSDCSALPEHAPGRLERLCAGSWVYGNFATWIGDAAKNRAWDLLCEAKQAFDLVAHSGRLDSAALLTAALQLAVCEGSDWFWWFGDYNPRAAVESFDRLFRENLAALYRQLGLPAPRALESPISRGGGEAEGGGTMRRAG